MNCFCLLSSRFFAEKASKILANRLEKEFRTYAPSGRTKTVLFSGGDDKILTCKKKNVIVIIELEKESPRKRFPSDKSESKEGNLNRERGDFNSLSNFSSSCLLSQFNNFFFLHFLSLIFFSLDVNNIYLFQINRCIMG